MKLIRTFNTVGHFTQSRTLICYCASDFVYQNRQWPIFGTSSVSRHFSSSDDSPKCCDRLMDAFRKCLSKRFKENDVETGNKVSIFGSSAVGMASAITMLSKGITNNIVIYDTNKKLCMAESLDLLHGSLFLNDCQIQECCEIELTRDSRVVVVTPEECPTANQTPLEVSQSTADILKEVMPELIKYSPNAVYIIASNPADVMTWVVQKITNLPQERCFSTGCHLDSARFRMLIAKTIDVATSSVQGFVIGEHGPNSVPLWSSVSMGGVNFQKIMPNIGKDEDPMHWSNVHKDVVEAAFRVISGKGYTNWAVGLTISDVVKSIFENSKRVLSLSTNVKGMCGIRDDVFLSLPCIVCKSGLCGIVRPQMTKWEASELLKSAKSLLEAQNCIKI